MKLVKNIILNWQDYFNLKTVPSKATSIDRAISKNLEDSRVFNKTAAEHIMHFLYIFGREETAENIRTILAKKDYPNDSLGHEQKIIDFLRAILETSHEIFEIDLPLVANDIPVYTHADIIRFYKDNDYANDLQKIYEYQRLITNLFNEMGYVPPNYDSNYPETSDDISLEKDDFIANFSNVLLLQANTNRQQNTFAVYKIKSDYVLSKKIQQNSSEDIHKQKYNKAKNRLFNFLLIISCIIGITESFLPFYFAFDSFSEMHFSRPVLVTLSGVVFVCAFIMSSFVFQTGSYTSFKNIFLRPKSTFFYDLKGEKLKWYSVLRNAVALILALFAAVSISSLSFSFYSNIFPFSIACVCVVANLIGWTGLLTNAVMSLLTKETFDDFLQTIKSLLISPIRNALKNLKSYKIILNLALFLVNSAVLLLMAFLSVGVISTTIVLFTSALEQVISNSALASRIIAPEMAKYIIYIAEIPLGIFFVKNICKITEFMRSSSLQSIKKIYSLSFMKQNYFMRHETTEYRRNAVKFRNRLAVVFILCSVINGLSCAAGYYSNSAVAEAVIWSALFFGIPKVYVPAVITASVFAAIANAFSSIGSSVFPAVNSVIYDKTMNSRRYKFDNKYFEVKNVDGQSLLSPNIHKVESIEDHKEDIILYNQFNEPMNEQSSSTNEKANVVIL